jgi:hypothetical protein
MVMQPHLTGHFSNEQDVTRHQMTASEINKAEAKSAVEAMALTAST